MKDLAHSSAALDCAFLPLSDLPALNPNGHPLAITVSSACDVTDALSVTSCLCEAAAADDALVRTCCVLCLQAQRSTRFIFPNSLKFSHNNQRAMLSANVRALINRAAAHSNVNPVTVFSQNNAKTLSSLI